VLYRRLYDLQFNQHESAPAAALPLEAVGAAS